MSFGSSSKSNDRRLLKGSAVGLAATGLLVGGGTFALWYDTEEISGNSINSGELHIEVDDAAGVWSNQDGLITPATYLIVPGDVLTLTQPVSVTAVGDELTASLTVDAGTIAGDPVLADALDVGFTVLTPPAGVTPAGPGSYTVTSPLGNADTPAVITAQVTITFPETTDGGAPLPDRSNYWNLAAQDLTIDLSSVAFDLVQST